MEARINKYILRPFIASDYDEFASWWESPPALEDLPKIGVICGNMKSAGFLARTDCSVSVITWWYCNPENKGKESYMALREVFKELCAISLAIGHSKIFCYSQKRGIVRMLESLGFNNVDGHMIGELSNG